MAESETLVAVNGNELWGNAVETTDGLRLRFALDDWDRLGLCEGGASRCACPARTTCGYSSKRSPHCRRSSG